MGKRIDVNIAGYALTVRTDRSEEHMARLAETLNGRVREIQKQGGTANYLNVIMLAAMELADEVLMFEERFQEVKQQVGCAAEGKGRHQGPVGPEEPDLLATLDDALK